MKRKDAVVRVVDRRTLGESFNELKEFRELPAATSDA